MTTEKRQDLEMCVERYRLHSMPHAQCHIRIERSKDSVSVELISYNTSVCFIELDENDLILYCSGTYSPTTAKHINRFTTEFLGRSHYFECKDALRNCIGSAKYQGFFPVAHYNEAQFPYKRFWSQIEAYENNSFFDWNVKKYYGSY